MSIQTKPTSSPPIPLVRLNHIPPRMRERKQWVIWRYKWQDDKWTKMPMLAGGDGRGASKTNPKDWLTFEQAVSWYLRYTKGARGSVGLGFIFTEDDPFVFIDLDTCRNPETGQLEPWAENFLREVPTYFEVSPRGGGLHAFAEGLLKGNRRVKPVEVYDHRAFATVTGAHLDGTPTDTVASDGGIAWIEAYLDELGPTRQYIQTPRADAIDDVDGDIDLTLNPAIPDEIVVRRIRESQQREKFELLFDAGDYRAVKSWWTQSEGVHSLLCVLAYWTRGDTERIDRLFRESALYVGWEEKWERLGPNEMAKACAFIGGYLDA